MLVREAWPAWGSAASKTNGPIHNGKQNHQCQACGRQCVADAIDRIMSHEQRTLIAHLWRERISLRGICRAVGGSLTWLLPFMVECCAACPDHFYVRLPHRPTDAVLRRPAAEADALWSFVQQQANKPWIWIAMDATPRQIMAFHGGDHSRDSAQELWAKSP